MLARTDLSLASPLTLPCGAVLPNRLAKAAMTEGLADAENRATTRHEALYRRWARGGAGLLLTGNVQVDRRYLERAGNVAIEPGITTEEKLRLEAFAAAAREGGGQVFMQISHAGRQSPIAVCKEPVAPSAVALGIPGKNFAPPRALEAGEIKDVAARFVHAARIAQETGFTGVQIHSAHGYLLSEFLSPRVNQRTDEWGGSLVNRARLLLAILEETRAAVGPAFPISVKLNSSDFQKGGFTHEECLHVVRWLSEAGCDLLEISGGTYEQPKMAGLDGILEPVFDDGAKASTRAREAYFLDYAARIRAAATMPLMVTGGFRTRAGMDAALKEDGVDVIGIARPLCSHTELVKGLLDGSVEDLPRWESTLRIGPGLFGPRSPFSAIRAANAWGTQGWFYVQLLRMGEGLEPDLRLSVLTALRLWQANETKAAKALRWAG